MWNSRSATTPHVHSCDSSIQRPRYLNRTCSHLSTHWQVCWHIPILTQWKSDCTFDQQKKTGLESHGAVFHRYQDNNMYIHTLGRRTMCVQSAGYTQFPVSICKVTSLLTVMGDGTLIDLLHVVPRIHPSFIKRVSTPLLHHVPDVSTLSLPLN